MGQPARVAQLMDGASEVVYQVPSRGQSPAGSLPLTDQMLREWPSGDLFGLTQNAGMGWPLREMLGPQCLIISTAGGMRARGRIADCTRFPHRALGDRAAGSSGQSAMEVAGRRPVLCSVFRSV